MTSLRDRHESVDRQDDDDVVAHRGGTSACQLPESAHRRHTAAATPPRRPANARARQSWTRARVAGTVDRREAVGSDRGGRRAETFTAPSLCAAPPRLAPSPQGAAAADTPAGLKMARPGYNDERRHSSIPCSEPRRRTIVRTPLILLAALVLVPSAFARTTRPTLTISASSSRVLYGHTVTLKGTLRQGLAAGRAVKIEAWRYGRSAPRRIAVVKTSIDGSWTLHVRPSLRTSYQAASATLTSRPVIVGVAPAVTVHLLTTVGCGSRSRPLAHSTAA